VKTSVRPQFCWTNERYSGGDLDVVDTTGCRRNWEFFSSQTLEMYLNRLTNRLFGFGNSRSGSHTSRQIWDICRIISARILNYNRVSHGNFTQP